MRVRPVLEVIGETDIVANATRLAVAPEAIFAPNHRWEIKAAVPLGVTDASPTFGLQLAVTWKSARRVGSDWRRLRWRSRQCSRQPAKRRR